MGEGEHPGALAKGPEGLRFQAEVAQNVRIRGVQVSAFARKVFDRFGKEIGEIDFETQRAIVEVTTSEKEKMTQAIDLATDRRLNPGGKSVIVYAPRYSPNAQAALAPQRIRAARTMDELMTMLCCHHTQ